MKSYAILLLSIDFKENIILSVLNIAICASTTFYNGFRFSDVLQIGGVGMLITVATTFLMYRFEKW